MARWGMVIDLDRCNGCQACEVACREENNVAVGGPEAARENRTISWMKVRAEVHGEWPRLEARFLPTPCMQCDRPPCVRVCPTGATMIDSEGPRRADLRALHRVPLLCERLPLHRQVLQLEGTGLSRVDASRPQSGRLHPLGGHRREVHVLPPPSAEGPRAGPRRGTLAARGGLRPGLRRELSDRRHHVRGSRRSPTPGGAPRPQHQGVPPARGARDGTEGLLPRRGEPDVSDLEKVESLPQDQRVLLRPLVRTTGWFWFWAAVMVVVAAWGGFAYYLQLRHGLGKTGAEHSEYWGIYIINFVFFIGISHAGTLISAILRISNAEWRRVHHALGRVHHGPGDRLRRDPTDHRSRTTGPRAERPGARQRDLAAALGRGQHHAVSHGKHGLPVHPDDPGPGRHPRPGHPAATGCTAFWPSGTTNTASQNRVKCWSV